MTLSMQTWMQYKWIRWPVYTLATILILTGVLAGITRALSPLASKYQPQIVAKLSKMAKMPVHIDKLQLSWYFFSPEIVLHDLSVSQPGKPEQTLVTVERLELVLNTWQSLWARRPIISSVSLKHVLIHAKAYDLLPTTSATTDKPRLPWHHLKLNIIDLTLPGYGKIPGLTGADIHLRLQRNQGTFAISFEDNTLHMPWLFRLPLQLQEADIEGSFREGKHAKRLTITTADLAIPEGDIQATAQIILPTAAPMYINIDATANLKHLTKRSVYNYLPLPVLSPNLLAWLDSAILQVDAVKTHFVLQGHAGDFPYLHNNGEFLVDSQLRNANLAYEAGWPVIHHIDAHMVFKGRSMQINATQAALGSLAVDNASVSIPVMDEVLPVVLQVDAKAHGDVSDVIGVLDTLPLSSISHLSDQLQGKGPVNVALTLALPLANAPKMQPRISGTADLQAIDLAAIQAPKLPLIGLTGQVLFNEQGLTADKLTGNWLNMPVVARITQGKQGQSQLSAILNLDMKLLQPMLPTTIANAIKGTTPVHLAAVASINQLTAITLTSQLQGLSLNFPAPLKKAAATRVPFKVSLQPGSGAGQWQIKGQYGKDLTWSSLFGAMNKKWSLQGLSLAWGGQASSVTQGIQLTVNQPQFNANPWMDFIQTQGSTNNSLPLQLSIKTNQLQLKQYRLNNVNLNANVQPNLINMNIISDEINGQINYQKASGSSKPQLQINLKSLQIPTTGATTAQKNMVWQSFPATQFSCQSLQVGALNLGQLSTSFTPTSDGLTINQLNIQTRSANLKASGSWIFQPGKTQLAGSISTRNLSQMLRDFGLAGNINANQVNAPFNLNWPGAPWQLSLANIAGNASLAIGAGRITGLSQSTNASLGLGKLITLLSVQGLMNLGNLTQEGFAFSKITGEFLLNQGTLTVSQAEMKGAVADMSFKGQIGLVQQTYNLRMQVVGRLTSSVPVVATIVGGPVVGAVAWVANKAVGSQVDKISGSQYLVTGTWAKPVITKQ